jgi:hypothetical protein
MIRVPTEYKRMWKWPWPNYRYSAWRDWTKSQKPVNITGLQLRYEPVTSWIQSRNATHLSTTSGACQITIQHCVCVLYHVCVTYMKYHSLEIKYLNYSHSCLFQKS